MATVKKLCAHCGATMVEYKRRLTKRMARTLVKFYRAGGPIHAYTALDMDHTDGSTFPFLRHWGLLQPIGGTRKGGIWELTDKGRAFVRGEVSVPAHIWTYRGNLRRFEGPDVFISDELPADEWRAEDYARMARPHNDDKS